MNYELYFVALKRQHVEKEEYYRFRRIKISVPIAHLLIQKKTTTKTNKCYDNTYA